MRCTFRSAILAALFLPGSVALAFSIQDQTPQSYDDVEQAITQSIPDELAELQCGGWKDESVNGKVVTVTGAPGRNHQWDGDVLSGMGTRIDENGNSNINDDYQYPELATGLTTGCLPGKETIEKTVWREKTDGRPGEIEEVDISYPHPKFEDPSCRWRRKISDDEFSNEAPDIPLLDSYTDPPKFEESDKEPPDADPPGDRQSPPTCREFCGYLNTWQYHECVEVGEAPDPVTGDPYAICIRWADNYLCTDQEVTDAEAACESNDADKANSIKCESGECRCEEDGGPEENGCVDNPGMQGSGEGDEESMVYYSYYRRYPVTFSRTALSEIDGLDDRSSNTAQVACYGFYDEFDPKVRQTLTKDRRCVINANVTGFDESQKGKGEYGQDSSFDDRNPNEDANQRNRGAFDADKDLWYLKLSGGFSLLNEKVFSGSYRKDLTNVFLNVEKLDRALMRATEQWSEEKPLMKSNQIRAFDETGSSRILVSWWQKQQNEMAAILHPQVIRMVLPSGWSFGVDPDDPFLQQVTKPLPTSADARGKRIELQIGAEEDIVGSAIGYIERSLLLDVHEEPVPLLLPIGSATEFRAKAEQWCLWYMYEWNVRDCQGAPQDVKDLIAKLELYADTIDEVRVLRGELARYAGKVLELQQQVVEPISEWMEENIDAYKEVLEEQKELRERIGPKWREVQEAFSTFTDQTNLPWCMNQRFTSPTYSMLDLWLPSRSLQNAPVTAELLPKITATPVEDTVIDFSTIAYMTGSIALPVLKPIQVRITGVPLPPDGREYTPITALPDLPSVDSIRDAIREAEENLPEPPDDTNAPPVIETNTLGEEGIAQLEGDMDAIKQLITDMDERYKKFWKSIGPWKEGDDDPDFDPEDIHSIGYKKPRLECEEWDDNTCQHVEMDLIERFVRIGSRPLVMLNEDYESVGYARGIGGPCMPENHVCTPMHPEGSTPRIQWEIIGPRNQEDNSDEIRSSVRDATLPEPVGGVQSSSFPKYDTDLKYLLPTYDVPQAIDLSVPRSRASSSSSSQ